MTRGPVLVTGGTGHLGSHVVPILEERGWEVLRLGRSPECEIRADLADPSSVAAHGARLGTVPVLLHAAHPMRTARPEDADAWPLVAASALALADLLGRLPALRRIVLVSSAAAERPRDVYGVTKRLEEDLLRLHAEDRETSLAVLRLSSVYGPGGRRARALDRFLREALAGRRPVVVGGEGPGTDYVYAADAARAVAAALDSGAVGRCHVAAGAAATPFEAARAAMRAVDLPGEPEVRPGPPSRGTGAVSPRDAEELLDWRPRYDLDRGLTEYAEWMRARKA